MTGLKHQYGVIPFIREYERVRLVLVTSRSRGIWIFPKGNPGPDMTKFQSAAAEAYEEAGVKGTLDRSLSYTTRFPHRGGEVLLELFPMEVDQILPVWPEDRVRRRCLVTPEKAEALIGFDGLKHCKREWEEDCLKGDGQ